MKLAFDTVEMKPGRVLLQAALGGSSEAAQKFHPDTWLLAPTPNLKVYETSSDQLCHLVERVHQLHKVGQQ